MPCHTETIDTGPHFEAMLCYVCSCYESGETFTSMRMGNAQVRTWWDQHKRRDRDRLQAEAEDAQIAEAKASALAKLTPEERNLLGFNNE